MVHVSFVLVVLLGVVSVFHAARSDQLMDRSGGNPSQRRALNDTSQRCYGEYGCFRIDGPWTSVIRPVNHFPEPPTVVKPSLCLMTRNYSDTCQPVDIGAAVAHLTPLLSTSKRFLFVAHGYLENGSKKWIKNLAGQVLKKEDVNVMIVDWSFGSGPPYTQAVANIRLVGVMLARFIVSLNTRFNVSTRHCYIVGHSLGAHLAGYAGHDLVQSGFQLGRITGLDPAEPYFEHTEPMIRLDASDALFVDVIHTDAGPFIAGGFGLMEKSGHVDFYPNGGVKQPGCDKKVGDYIDKEQSSLITGIRRFLGCNHVRAYEFFIESINSACPFLAVECGSWKDFRSGLCTCQREQQQQQAATCFRMGYLADQSSVNNTRAFVNGRDERHVKAFLTTSSVAPYCQYHYEVTVFISDTEDSRQHGGDRGYLSIQLHGQFKSSDFIQLTEESTRFEASKTYSFIIGTPYLGTVNRVSVQWQFRTSRINPLTWRILTAPHIYINHVALNNLETDHKIEVCAHDAPLASDELRHLIPDADCRLQSIMQIDWQHDGASGTQLRRKTKRKLFIWG